MIHRALASFLLVAALTLLAQGERLKATGTFDGDPFSLYAVALILASLLLSRGSGRAYGVSLAFILVVSTRNLLLVGGAMASVAVLFAGRRAYGALLLLAPLLFIGQVDLARIEDGADLPLAVFLVGLLVTWLAIHRSVVSRDAYVPGESLHVSFSGLVAVTASVLRIGAWLPDFQNVERALALGGLSLFTLGALGVFFALDRRNLVRWSLVMEAGLLCLCSLGGVQARPFVLAGLVVAGAAVYLIASARDRVGLAVGALALFSPPPFPGFALLLPVSSAVIAEGHTTALLLALPAHLVLGVGAIRYAWKRADVWDSELSESPVAIPTATPAGAVLAAAAVFLLGAWAEPLIELARLAASGVF